MGWPATIGFGMLVGAWWKVIALAAGAFLVLVPLLGALTPRAQSEHYVAQIRNDLRQRIAHGDRDADELRRILARITAPPPT